MTILDDIRKYGLRVAIWNIRFRVAFRLLPGHDKNASVGPLEGD